MHHLLLINFFESVNQLSNDYTGLKLGEPASSELLQVFDVSSVAEFHNEIKSVLCALNVMQADYIRTIDFRQDVDLILEVAEQSRRKTFFLDNLNREILLMVIL